MVATLTRLGSALLLAGLGGCVMAPVTQTNDAPKIATATADQVASCTLLSLVSGSSPLHGFFYPQGLENAKREAMDRAAFLGATHLVWAEPTAAIYNTGIAAKAYRCS